MVMTVQSDFLISSTLSEPELNKGKWSIPDAMAHNFVYAVEHGCSVDVAIDHLTDSKCLFSYGVQRATKKLMHNEIVRKSSHCMYILKNI